MKASKFDHFYLRLLPTPVFIVTY